MAAAQIRHVGVVEDSDHDFFGLQRVAGDCSLTRWIAGDTAVDAVRSGDFPLDGAVVIVDHNLPGMSGIDVIRALRAMPGGGDAAIVMWTDAASPVVEEQAYRAGADQFHRKPATIAELRAFFDQATSSRIEEHRENASNVNRGTPAPGTLNHGQTH